MKIRLEEITVYSITGKKHIYKLGDMGYGEWLIFKNNSPVYYLNIFDELYKNIDESVKKDPYKYLEKKFKQQKKGFALSQGIHGLWSSKIVDKWFDLEKLPLNFLECETYKIPV